MLNDPEQLRALLAEAMRRLKPSPGGPAATIDDLSARIMAALKPEPAPLPYTVQGPTGTTVVDADGRTLFAVSTKEETALATAEFIARACSSFPELLRVAREGYAYARAQAPSATNRYDLARAAAVIEAATGEKP